MSFEVPNHVELGRRSQATTYAARAADVASLARELGDEPSVTFVSFSSVEEFGGRADDYYDGVHMRGDNMDRLTRALVARARIGGSTSTEAVP